ncbi:hypothetical protein LTR85_002698 [Meristemomyces frigidus]|nr:hypothetical protein LTR85_002698 [Meristemomyces frigidus]
MSGLSAPTAEAATVVKMATFFDLPAELRLQIYNYLLPYRKILSWGCSIAFIRTNRQIYEEACEAFYGSGTFELGVHGWSKAHPIGYVNFLTQTVDLDDIPGAACFRLLKRVRSLRLRIKAFNTERAIREGRDTLVSLLRRLDSDHRLEQLDVTVDISEPAATEPPIMPQDVAPAALICFITEPLLTIRRNAEAAMTVTVSAVESQPLPSITDHYLAAINSDNAVPVTNGFDRCFAILRRLMRVAHSLPAPQKGLEKCDNALRLLCRARLLADVHAFRESHVKLAEKMEKLASANLQASLASAKVRTDRTQLMHTILAWQEAVAEMEGDSESDGREKRVDEGVVVKKPGEAVQNAKKRNCEWPDLVGGRKKARVVDLDGSDSESDDGQDQAISPNAHPRTAAVQQLAYQPPLGLQRGWAIQSAPEPE